jgi:hypothetical protein
MTIKTILTGSELQPRAAPDQAELDRIAEERSENEGMPEYVEKAKDPGAWQKKGIEHTVDGMSSGGAKLSNQPAISEDSISSAENTDLERRVLAHERILQSLIAHMAEAEPKFVDRLVSTFSEPMRLARSEHDYTDTDSYAERFVREVIRLGEPSNYPVVVRRPSKRPDNSSRAESVIVAPKETLRTLFQVTLRSGIWEVTKDRAFYGHYFLEKPAMDAALAAASDIAAAGGVAEVSRGSS